MRALALFAFAALTLPAQLRIECSWDRPLDGRLVLVLANTPTPEPRFQTSEGLDTQQIFGIDVTAAGTAAIDIATPGYPRDTLLRVPAGEYWVQAVLNIYETYHLADGRTLKLPPDRGEGQHWNRKPGNLYSDPVRLHIDASSNTPLRLNLARTIPPIAPPQDTRYVRHVRIESKLLTAFWGRPTYLGAVVVVPEGFDEHPERRYPAVYYQGHFAATFTAMRGAFAQDWSAGKIPRMIIVNTQDANPYYDDSYAVNSANLGPYGDALTQELYPYVERQFHAIAQPWARAVYGGSTGGWRALALQIFHPDYFNGAWAVAPDPVDFRAYCMVNLYDDANAFFAPSQWKQVPVPMLHNRDGRIEATMQDAVRYETVLGERGRSGEQFDIWQAAYSPPGPDGYPKAIFDPQTGVIDHAVAEYWKLHYDLIHHLRTNWKSLSPQLAGKLHITSGVFDAFYLDRPARLAQEFLDTVEPGAVEFSSTAGHGALPPGTANPSQLTFHERVIRALEARILKTAPPGADMTSWR